MNAYSELYIEDAMRNMGEMMEYASIACDIPMDRFFKRFIVSGYASAWEDGDPALISGKSGTELCRRVLEKTSDKRGRYPDPLINYDTGEEYWCGWIMAYIQWRLNKPFLEIMKVADFEELMRIYPAMHTASEERCAAFVLDMIHQRNRINRLKFYRQLQDMTQKELAERSEVNLRTLQQYEAGSKDLGKASAISVMKLARALDCKPEDLLLD